MNNDNNEKIEIEETDSTETANTVEPVEPDKTSVEIAEDTSDMQAETDDNTDSADENDSDTEYADDVPPVKSRDNGLKIYSPLIIATLVLALLVVGSSVYFLFFTNNTGNTIFHKLSGRTSDSVAGGSIFGTWLYRNGDIASFYTFTDDGRLEVTNGTVTSATKYAFDSKSAGVINVYSSMDPSDNDSSSPLSYEITKVDGITTLKISDPSDNSRPMAMQLSSLPNDLLEVSSDFVADESIIGTWESEENDIKITFENDGHIAIYFPTMTLKGVYELSDGKLTYKYTYNFDGSDQNTDTFNYEVDGDSFKFFTDNYEYTLTRVKSEG